MEYEIEKKNFDIKIILRLSKYIKPFILQFILAFILLLSLTGLQLIKPLIIGNAIDNFINGYKKNYVVFDIPIKDSLFLNGKYIKYVKNYNFYNNFAKLVYLENSYFIFINLKEKDLDFLNSYDFSKLKIKNSINVNGFNGIKLTKEQLRILRKNDIQGIIFLSFIFIFVIILSFLSHLFQNFILELTSQKILFNIRNEIFEKIINLPMKFYDNTQVGKLVTRVTNDTETLNEMFTTVIIEILRNVVLIIAIVIIMFRLNLTLSLLSLSVLPFVVITTIIFRKVARNNYRSLRKAIADINTFLSEHLFAMKIIQLYNLINIKFNKFLKLSENLKKIYYREINIFAIFRPLMFLFSILSTCIVLYIGGVKVLNLSISFGLFFVFIYYIDRLYEPIQDLSEQFNVLQSAMASSEKIFEILDEKNEIIEIDNPVVITSFNNSIVFKNVYFAYKDDEWVLKNINFEVKKGEKIAFVGATGSGKTTIINLLLRFYDIQKGDIFIDGINIKDIKIESLRNLFGIVLQDVFIFNQTVKENILLNNSLPYEKLVEKCRYVHADIFIEKLEKKYDTILSENGKNLSFGERQLLSFARAIVKEPEILVLDEATSNIDTETEKYIQDALIKMIENKTSIVIAHRLSTIKHCDKIIVLSKGEIKEIGTHEELMKKKGIYYNLYKLNFMPEGKN
ncbi:MAG TPA: ABC transporter ATP-binding protein [Spirochaetota bacterium]|nr:ABC transporter ATP-binding protein [Spirochaetota bacterium]HOL57008.1 ABC transporter ATP-binding protein [Spirochaetota bacterium]